MKQLADKIGLIHTIRRVTIIIYGVMIICFAFIGILDKVTFLRNETEKIRNNYTEEQKLIVKTQVQSAVQLIQLARKSNISETDILESLKSIRFGSDNDGYIFVNTYNGIPLLFDAKRVIDGDNIWELTDPNGVKVIQEERRAVRNSEGDFIYYSWLKLSTNTISPKVSFIKGVPEWKWLVGAGVYLDSIETEIITIQKKIMMETGIEASFLLLAVAAILVIIQIIFKRFTKSVEEEIILFSSYFDRAAINSEQIDISNIRYSEFSHIADDMNQMVASKLEADERIFTSEQRLRLQREQSPLGYIEYDLNSKVVYWNPSAERIFGYSREDMMGKGLDILLPLEMLDNISEVFNNMMNGSIVYDRGVKNINKNITSTGKEIICEWYNKTLTDKDGTVLGIVALVDDITQRKLMEDKLEKSLDEKQILLKEVHHRVKNNMAIISSFISLQSMSVEDKDVQALLQSTENRVRSMALIHEYLYKSENLKDINVPRYIEELVKILLNSYEYGIHDLNTTIEISQFELELDLLIPLGMIINEIISNALKHAFIGIDSPKLFINLFKRTSKEIILTIKDNGVGLPGDNDLEKTDSIGFLLINSLVAQIYSKIEINRKNGTEYIITVPVKLN
ncbi:MAG: cache domain-containing protein [Spirochaetales bacterium]|nr:cache domain-containing protein [Spirochaetales bacterium]